MTGARFLLHSILRVSIVKVACDIVVARQLLQGYTELSLGTTCCITTADLQVAARHRAAGESES
jgi:hypothetical protein